MALVHIRDAEGKLVLVHTSVFDTHRRLRLEGDWADVWARVDHQAQSQGGTVVPTANVSTSLD